MSKKEEIAGGFAYQCDWCEHKNGRETYYWKEKNFNLCFRCVRKLFFTMQKDKGKQNGKWMDTTTQKIKE